MDLQDKAKRVEALEAIKSRALKMASEGEDSLGVREFIQDAKQELAYELPDEDAFRKAAAATMKYKGKSGKSKENM
jgi:uncharacterized protein YpuA (DUF1002 family)